MSGLITCYKINLSNGIPFREAVVFTKRYSQVGNYLALYPRQDDIAEVAAASFAATHLPNTLNPQTVLYTDYTSPMDWSNPKPRPKFLKEIRIPTDKAHEAVVHLFQRSAMSGAERSEIAAPIRELERCPEYHQRLSNNISSAQRSILESFFEPYINTLQENMARWQIVSSIDKAKIIVKGYVDPDSARSVLASMWIEPNPWKAVDASSNPTYPILDKEWDDATKTDVLDALYVIARISTGKAHLEDALLQSGFNLPTLEVQEQVVMGLFRFADLVESNGVSNARPSSEESKTPT